MAKKKEVPVKQEGKPTPPDAPEVNDYGDVVEHVWIKRPIQKDGLLDGGGWEEKLVPKGPAMEQLALPKEQRNSHWKNAQLSETPVDKEHIS